mmetsp:Transcript_26880/g.74086  ORF Transcript_26880/g.74086 Transcript_26880/m.74086 type:complete len:89 (+) Transcript_26880:1109-1375(+)
MVERGQRPGASIHRLGFGLQKEQCKKEGNEIHDTQQKKYSRKVDDSWTYRVKHSRLEWLSRWKRPHHRLVVGFGRLVFGTFETMEFLK